MEFYSVAPHDFEERRMSESTSLLLFSSSNCPHKTTICFVDCGEDWILMHHERGNFFTRKIYLLLIELIKEADLVRHLIEFCWTNHYKLKLADARRNKTILIFYEKKMSQAGHSCVACDSDNIWLCCVGLGSRGRHMLHYHTSLLQQNYTNLT